MRLLRGLAFGDLESRKSAVLTVLAPDEATDGAAATRSREGRGGGPSSSSSGGRGAVAARPTPSVVLPGDAASGRSDAPKWGALDDVVMGGASLSTLVVGPDADPDPDCAAVFRGTINTANRGGFASVRSLDWSPPLDAAAWEGIVVKLRSDGRRLKLILRTEQNPGWDSVCFAVSFDSPGSPDAPATWGTVHLPFDDFRAVFRAKTLTGPTAPRLVDQADGLTSFQLMHSKARSPTLATPR